MEPKTEGFGERDILCVGESGLPRVILVDDAWFQPDFDRHYAFAAQTFPDPEPLSFDTFQARLEEASVGLKPNEKYPFDLDLLQRLLSRCRSAYQLCICSFAAFGKRFASDLDRADTAILISMGHDASDNLTFKGPGLLQSSLRGCRPRAEIVFISGYPREFSTYMQTLWADLVSSAADDRQLRIVQARWWIMRSFSVIEKYTDTLDAHLNGFFDYFAQRFQQDVLQQLVRALFQAQELNPGCGPDGDPAHLRHLAILEAWEERNGSFPLSQVFLQHEGDPSGAVESFKALYSMNQEAKYGMSGQVLRRLLRLGGFDLVVDFEERFHLPTCPGAIFVFGLLRFLIEMRQTPMEITLEKSTKGIQLRIPMDRVEIFQEALTTRNSGGTVTAFRDWLAGNTGPLVETEARLNPMLQNWERLRAVTLDGHRPVWRSLLNFSTGDGVLVVSADSNSVDR